MGFTSPADGGPKRAPLPRGTLTAVECPTCGAKEGKGCTTSGGKPSSKVHDPRHHLAMRAYHAKREEKGHG